MRTVIVVLVDGQRDQIERVKRAANDAPPSWPFITPAITATAEVDHLEICVRTTPTLRRHWAASSFGAAELPGLRQAPREIAPSHTILEFTDRSRRDVTLAAHVPDTGQLFVSVVRNDTLVPRTRVPRAAAALDSSAEGRSAAPWRVVSPSAYGACQLAEHLRGCRDARNDRWGIRHVVLRRRRALRNQPIGATIMMDLDRAHAWAVFR